jgi:hypothetical protein
MPVIEPMNRAAACPCAAKAQHTKTANVQICANLFERFKLSLIFFIAGVFERNPTLIGVDEAPAQKVEEHRLMNSGAH